MKDSNSAAVTKAIPYNTSIGRPTKGPNGWHRAQICSINSVSVKA